MHPVRNIGIVAHIDAGKTTLTERILFDAGSQAFLGEVDEGTATMDYTREERERGISIGAAATQVAWRGHRIHVIDTPGHVDFTAEVERCLRVLDGVIVLLDGVRGVESQTVSVWRQADRRGLPRLVFVNKLDRAGADLAACVTALRERFDCRPAVVVEPLYLDGWRGLADLVDGTVFWFDGEPPAEALPALRRQLAVGRDRLLETCAEFDDAILGDWLEGRPVGAARLRSALRAGCLGGRIVPVLGGAALPNLGVDLLLDAVCALLPGPADRPDWAELGGESAPAVAFVFKVQHDEVVQSHVRVFAGTLRPGQPLRVARTGELVAPRELWAMHAASHSTVAAAAPGDVVVLPAVEGLVTGDTLHDPARPTSLPGVDFPAPVVAAAFEPARPDDIPVLLAALRRLATDDPTLAVSLDPDAAIPMVAGMGELHLEIVADRVRRATGLPVRLGRPTVALRETVLRRGEGQASVQAMHAGRPVRAEARVVVAPAAGDETAVVLAPDLVVGPVLRLALEGELRARLRSGLHALLPATAVTLTVTEIGGDAPEALEALYLQALRYALAKAVAAAGPARLEPMASFELSCPADSLSPVLADLQARQASVRQVASGSLGAVVQGSARLASMLGYTSRLRSITKGLGIVQLQPDGYAPVPTAERLLEKGAEKLDPGQGDR